MAIIEQIPVPDEAAENESAKEELFYGKYSLTESEKDEIRRKAEAEGRDPEEAVKAEEARMAAATARLREQQAEEAVKRLKRDFQKP